MIGIDVIGQRFGLLVVSAELQKAKKQRVVLCKCDCGNIKAIHLSNMRAGHTKSCGCQQKHAASAANKTHGLTHTREFTIWMNMKSRCNNEKAKDYPSYGGRGISVCKRWIESFASFLLDMGNCPRGYSIDRIDVNGNYEPSNCRWATSTQQANNTRANRIIEFDGKTQTLAQACASRGLNYKTVHKRLRDGWTIEKSLLTTTA